MTAFIPRVICAKCGKLAEIKRVHDPRRSRRFVEVKCHGERAEVAFASKPDTEVKLWAA